MSNIILPILLAFACVYFTVAFGSSFAYTGPALAKKQGEKTQIHAFLGLFTVIVGIIHLILDYYRVDYLWRILSAIIYYSLEISTMITGILVISHDKGWPFYTILYVWFAYTLVTLCLAFHWYSPNEEHWVHLDKARNWEFRNFFLVLFGGIIVTLGNMQSPNARAVASFVFFIVTILITEALLWTRKKEGNKEETPADLEEGIMKKKEKEKEEKEKEKKKSPMQYIREKIQKSRKKEKKEEDEENKKKKTKKVIKKKESKKDEKSNSKSKKKKDKKKDKKRDKKKKKSSSSSSSSKNIVFNGFGKKKKKDSRS